MNASTDIVHGWTYGAHNQKSSYTDPQGRTTTFTLDTSGNTTQITYPTITSPAGQTITETFTHDSAGRILTAADGAGRKVAFAYYATGSQAGWLNTVIRDPAPGLALTTTFSYGLYGSVTGVQDPRGSSTSITVDLEGFVTEIQAPSPLSYRRRFTYDVNRNVVKAEVENLDRKGVPDSTTPWIDTTFTYDLLDRLISKTHRLTASTTATTSYQYEGSGLLSQITHPESNVDTFVWEERQLLFTATRGYGTAEASTVQFDYGLNGTLSQVTDGRGNATTFTSDLFGRRTKTTNALSHYVDVSYDKSGNVTKVEAYDASAVLQARTTSFFDEVGRKWKVQQDRFGPGLATTYPATTITRDQGHLVTQVQDPLGNATTYGHDTAGRLITVTDAASNVRTLTLDANGNATKIADTEVPASGPAETFETEFSYDVLNRKVERREIDRLNASNILTTSYEYNSRSDLTFRTDAEGNPVRWTYDLASRLTKYERALQVGASIDVFLQSIDEVFQFDKNDRLTSSPMTTSIRPPTSLTI